MTKHSAVRGMLSSLVVLTVSLPSGAFAAPQDGPQGVWTGAIEVPGQTLEIIITLREATDSKWTGSIDIPVQNLVDSTLSDVAVAADSVSFAMAGIPGDPSFVGSWDAEKQTITGDFVQGGGTFPFTLSRTGDAAPAASPASVDGTTLRVDLSYAQAFFEGTLSADGSMIEGTWNQGGGSLPLTVEKQ